VKIYSQGVLIAEDPDRDRAWEIAEEKLSSDAAIINRDNPGPLLQGFLNECEEEES